MGAIAQAGRVVQRAAWWAQPGPQTFLLSCPIGDILFGGARGGGKTDGMLGDFAKHAGEFPHAVGLLLRRTVPELDAVKERAQEIYPKLGAVWAAATATWHFPNGATLRLRHLDRDEDASKYQGHSYTWIGIDEAGNFGSPEPIDKLKATLRNRHRIPSRMIMTANPGGPGHEWLKSRYMTGQRPMRPFRAVERIADEVITTERVFIPSRLENNRILVDNDPGYRARVAVAAGSTWLAKAWLNGDWSGRPTGGVLKPESLIEEDVDAHDLVRKLGLRPRQFWDFAVTQKQKKTKVNARSHDPDGSACITAARDELNRVWILDAFWEQWGPERVAPAAIGLQRTWNATVAGEAGLTLKMIQTQLDLLARDDGTGGIWIEPLTKGGQDKVAHSLGLQMLLHGNRLYVPRNAPWLKMLKDQFANFPTAGQGIHDDLVDACSYMAADLGRMAIGKRPAMDPKGAWSKGMTAEDLERALKQRRRNEEEDEGDEE